MRSLRSLFVALAGTLMLVGCGGGSDSAGTPLFNIGNQSAVPLASSAEGAIALVPGGSTLPIAITGGKAPYKINSTNVSVASVAPLVDTPNLFSVVGVAEGAAAVIVTDAAGSLLSIEVMVSIPVSPLSTSVGTNLQLVAGASTTFSISGGVKPYNLTIQNPSLVQFSLGENSEVALSAASPGSTSLTVKDSSDQTVNIALEVRTVSLAIDAPSGVVTMGTSQTRRFPIRGGRPGYTAQADNGDLVSVDVQTSDAGERELVVRSAANRIGPVQVTLFDQDGSRANVALLISEPALYVGTSEANLSVGSSQSYDIGGGVKPYAVSSSSPGMVKAEKGEDGDTLRLTALATGNSTVRVHDAVGSEFSLTVTAGPALPLSTTAPPSISIAPGATPNYRIAGGVAPYSAVSDTVSIADAGVVEANTLRITGVTGGTALVQVRDAQGAVVDIAVQVSSLANPALSVSPGADQAGAVGERLNFEIRGGSPDYTVSSSNGAVASVMTTATGFSASLLRQGQTVVSITDSRGQIQTVSIVVTEAPGTALFVAAPTSLSLSVGVVQEYDIGGGSPPYSVSSGGVIKAELGSTGLTLKVTPLAVGAATVVVRDSAGAIVERTVTVVPTPAVALFTSAPSVLTLSQGDAPFFEIRGGTSPYFASSDNPAVVTASAAENLLTIRGDSVGTSSVVVKDAAGAQVIIAVTVGSRTPLFTSAPSSVVMAAGTDRQFVMGGGSPLTKDGQSTYLVESTDVSVARVTVTGTTLSIRAVSGGQAQITITDSVGARASFRVDVGQPIALHTTAPDDVVLSPGADKAQRYEIRGGSASYDATSSNAAVASVDVVGNQLTVTGQAIGTALVVVTDSAGSTTTIAVTVSSDAAVPMTVAPLAATGTVGDTLRFEVRGGTPPYDYSVNNMRVASLESTSPEIPVIVRMDNVGETVITVTDAAGQVQEVPLRVLQSVTQLRLSPATLLLPETYDLGNGDEDSTNIILNIFGGIGPYRVYTTDLTRTFVDIEQDSPGDPPRVRVARGPQNLLCSDTDVEKYVVSGSGPLDPTLLPSTFFDIVITVIDAQGAAATAKLAVVDDGLDLDPSGTCR